MRKYLIVKIIIVCFVILNLNGCVTDKSIYKIEKTQNINKGGEMYMNSNNIPYSIRQHISYVMRIKNIEKHMVSRILLRSTRQNL